MFKIKNKYIEGLIRWLQGQLLSAENTRARTWFLRILEKQMMEVENQRIELAKKYAKRDKRGEPMVIIAAGGKKVYDLTQESINQLNSDFAQLLEQEFSFQVNEKELFERVSVLVLETQLPFGLMGGEDDNERRVKLAIADNYTEWCRAFEEVVLK